MSRSCCLDCFEETLCFDSTGRVLPLGALGAGEGIHPIQLDSSLSSTTSDQQQDRWRPFAVIAVDQKEVETLYWRFRALDRGHKGFVTSEELLAIPELSINPLAPRIVRMLDGSNLKDFVRFLAAFSPRASREAKLRFMFEVYDVDGDGVLGDADLRAIVRYLTGSQLTDEQVAALLRGCLPGPATAGPNVGGVSFEDFCGHAKPDELEVSVPVRF